MCQQRVYSYLWLHSKNLIRRLAVFASKVTNVDTAYCSWKKLNKPSEPWNIYIYIFFILWCNKIEPSSLSWKIEQDTKFAGFMTHFLLPIFPGSPGWKIESRYVSDTCGRANSISTRIRACGRGHFWVPKEKYPDTCGRGLGEKSFVLSLRQNYINLSGFPCWMQTEKGPWIQSLEVDYF